MQSKHIFALALSAACFVGLLVGSVVTFAVMQGSYSINNVARIKALGVGIYSNETLTQSLTQINWGLVAPGETLTFPVYIRNSGNTPITLGLSSENWNPTEASLFIEVSWDYQGNEIAPSEGLSINFELSVDPAISGVDSFSFTLVVSGSG